MFRKIANRLQFSAAIVLWCAYVMAVGSLIFMFILGRNFKEFYFGESYLFYEMGIVLAASFIIGLLIPQNKKNKKVIKSN